MNLAHRLAEGLEELGTKYIFGVAGDIQTEFHRALKSASIEFIAARNEKSAVFMADAYARVSRQPGVCFSTVGPGITNMITGLANATDDRSPVVAISDHVHLGEIGIRQAHQHIPVEKIFNSETGIVKEGFLVRDAAHINDILERAFVSALTEYQGAVHIAIPADLYRHEPDGDSFSRKLSLEEVKERAKCKNRISKDAIEDIYRAINGKKNILLLGGSPLRHGIQGTILKFIEQAGIPVMTTFRGKGTIPESHPLFVITISRHLQSTIQEILSEAENILFAGYDYNEGLKPSMWEGDNHKLINLEVVDNRVDAIFSPERSWFGDLEEVFTDLAARQYDQTHWLDVEQTRKNIRREIYKDLDMGTYPPRPHRIIEMVNKIFPDAIKVCDVGLNKYYSGLLLEINEPGTVLFSNGQSSMAFSSGAIGAKLAAPERHVVAITGDGGFLMDPQEISTAVRYNIPVTTIIFNDSALGLVKRKQNLEWDDDYGVTFPSPNYVELASSFGAKGYSVRSWAQFKSVLEEARRTEGPVLIDVPVDYVKGI